jgi:predicted NUDIX family NTP pyrophosphohydrolase
MKGEGTASAPTLGVVARSAGILPYRLTRGLEVLIGHPGGPLWSRRDAGSWSIVKGLVEPSESGLEAARREFLEETGWSPPDTGYRPLGDCRLRSGKMVAAWAVEAELDPDTLRPGTFEMAWPPGSGRVARFPEIDRVGWFDPGQARRRLNPAQRVFVDRLERSLNDQGDR